MSDAISWHPDNEMLLRYTDQDVSPAASRRVAEHLNSCGRCRAEVEELGRTLGDLRRFHQTVKAGLPAPPRPWGQPRWSELAGEPAPRRILMFPSKRFIAAAAAVAAAVLVFWLESPPKLSAAELLYRAEAKEQATPPAPRRKIRLHSKKHSWIRPARLDAATRSQPGDGAVFQGLLRDAGFGWEDPLGAAAFAKWRNGLSEKHDQLRKTAESYIVTTSTPAGVLSEASLTLRASDLHAVQAILKYRSEEIVEMAEVAEDTVTPEVTPVPAAPVETVPRPVEMPKPVAGPAELVRVMAALHRIGADLGDPVEVKRDDSEILVEGAGLSALRRDQIRAALARISGVRLALEMAGEHRRRATEIAKGPVARADASNPLLDQLRAAAGNASPDPGDALIDASDRTVQRAYALATLARQFPAETEASLAPADAVTVRGIARDHVEGLSTALRQMTTLLKAFASSTEPVPAVRPGLAWQEIAEGLLAAAKDSDQELNTGSTSDLDNRKARLNTGLERLRTLAEAARSRLR